MKLECAFVVTVSRSGHSEFPHVIFSDTLVRGESGMIVGESTD